MILPAEWRTLPDFARRSVGTGPYSVVRNHPSQLTIRTFDDYFGYRALIDEVNIWLLPELSQELSYSGVQLQNMGMPPGRRRQLRRCCGNTSGRGVLLFALRPALVAHAMASDTPLALLPYTPQAGISGRRPTDFCRAGTIAVMNRRRRSRQS